MGREGPSLYFGQPNGDHHAADRFEMGIAEAVQHEFGTECRGLMLTREGTWRIKSYSLRVSLLAVPYFDNN